LSNDPAKIGTTGASHSTISQNANKPVLPPPLPPAGIHNVVVGEPNDVATHSTFAQKKKLSPSVLLPKHNTSSAVEDFVSHKQSLTLGFQHNIHALPW
jgi:hypothetical protein